MELLAHINIRETRLKIEVCPQLSTETMVAAFRRLQIIESEPISYFAD